MSGVTPIFDRDQTNELNRQASLGEVTQDFKKLKIWQIENNYRYANEVINVTIPAGTVAGIPGTIDVNCKRASDSDMIIEQMSMQMFNVTNFPVPPLAPIFFDGSPFPPNQNRNALYVKLLRPDVNRSKANIISLEQLFGDGKQPTVMPESYIWKKNDNLEILMYNFCTVPIRVILTLEGYFSDYVQVYPKYTVENLRANYNPMILDPSGASAGAPVLNYQYNWFHSNFGDEITLLYNGTGEYDTIIYGLNCNFNLAEYMSVESMTLNNTIPYQYTPQISECAPITQPVIGNTLQQTGFIGNISGDGRFPHILTSPIVLRGANDQLRITLRNRLNAPAPIPAPLPAAQSLIDYFSMTAYVLEAYVAKDQK